MIDAAGRELRVSSPDRVIFPPTERTAAVTKLALYDHVYPTVEEAREVFDIAAILVDGLEELVTRLG
jgi:DNA primase